jgi:hypothetical protein
MDLSPQPAWAETWHLWTIIFPRRSITGRTGGGRRKEEDDEPGDRLGNWRQQLGRVRLNSRKWWWRRTVKTGPTPQIELPGRGSTAASTSMLLTGSLIAERLTRQARKPSRHENRQRRSPGRLDTVFAGAWRQGPAYLPCPTQIYDETIRVMKSAVRNEKLGRDEEMRL